MIRVRYLMSLLLAIPQPLRAQPVDAGVPDGPAAPAPQGTPTPPDTPDSWDLCLSRIGKRETTSNTADKIGRASQPSISLLVPTSRHSPPQPRG